MTTDAFRREHWGDGMVVHLSPGESIESALRRFKKATQRANIAHEYRQHMAYDKPSIRRRKKRSAARKRRGDTSGR